MNIAACCRPGSNLQRSHSLECKSSRVPISHPGGRFTESFTDFSEITFGAVLGSSRLLRLPRHQLKRINRACFVWDQDAASPTLRSIACQDHTSGYPLRE